MSRARWITVLILLSAAGLAAAGWQVGEPPARAATGRTAPPARVVSLSPSTTENVFALGFGDRLVGVTTGCRFPAAADTLPKVGGETPDLERVVALRPDLVVGDGSLSGRHLARIEAMGLPVWTSRGGATIEDIFDDLASLARALGDAERGRAPAASLRARCARVREALAGVPDAARPRVLFQYWPDPLWTTGRGTFLDDVIGAAGGRNVASDLREGWGTVQWEAVLAADPDFVVLERGGLPACERLAGWGALRAVRAGRVLEVDRDLFVRPTPRLVEGIELLARALHPERF